MTAKSWPSPVQQPDAEDLRVLRRLPAIALREGYIDSYCVFGQHHLRFDAVRGQLDALPPSLRALMRLFFLAEAVEPAELLAAFTVAELSALCRLGILFPKGERLHTGGIMLLPTSGLVMLVPVPVANPLIYFGDDSAALAERLSPPAGARCLDLCAGPGIQALRASRAGGKVVAVEINPLPAAFAELNIALNGLSDRMEVRRGDLYAALRPGEQFDFVSANPPLLPFVPELPYPFVGHGGGDGLAVTRRILRGLPSVLAPDGIAQIIGTCLGNDDGPQPRAELGEFAAANGLRVIMTVPARLPLALGTPMFDGLVMTCAHAAEISADLVRQKFAAHLEQLQANYLYTYYLTISRGSAGLLLTEHFRRPGGFWYR